MAAGVLAAVDPLDPIPPVRFAAALAGRAGAALTLVAVVGDHAAVTPLAAGQSGEDLAPDADELLERVVRIARDEGVEADSLTVVATSAPRGLSLTAVELGAGLLVVGSGAGGPSGQLKRGPTAERLLNGAPCAVALVPEGTGWRARRRRRLGGRAGRAAGRGFRRARSARLRDARLRAVPGRAARRGHAGGSRAGSLPGHRAARVLVSPASARSGHARRAGLVDDRLGSSGPRWSVADEHGARAGRGQRVERGQVALAVDGGGAGDDPRTGPAACRDRA